MMRLRKTSGFTLLELGLVLIVLSLLVSGALSIATQNIRETKKKELEAKMNAIEDAIIAYRKANGFLPCPGDAETVVANRNFGFQSVNPGTCTNGTGGALQPAATFSSGNTVAGMVPVRTLGLPDEYAFDPWGNKFFYAVDARATIATGFGVASMSNANPIGSITVLNAAAGTTTANAIMLLMSFGPNGHGAYIKNTRKYTGSVNTQEQENCDCTDSAGGAFDGVFYSQPPTNASTSALNVYDDVVRYYSRGKLTGGSEAKTEK